MQTKRRRSGPFPDQQPVQGTTRARRRTTRTATAVAMQGRAPPTRAVTRRPVSALSSCRRGRRKLPNSRRWRTSYGSGASRVGPLAGNSSPSVRFGCATSRHSRSRRCSRRRRRSPGSGSSRAAPLRWSPCRRPRLKVALRMPPPERARPKSSSCRRLPPPGALGRPARDLVGRLARCQQAAEPGPQRAPEARPALRAFLGLRRFEAQSLTLRQVESVPVRPRSLMAVDLRSRSPGTRQRRTAGSKTCPRTRSPPTGAATEEALIRPPGSSKTGSAAPPPSSQTRSRPPPTGRARRVTAPCWRKRRRSGWAAARSRLRSSSCQVRLSGLAFAGHRRSPLHHRKAPVAARPAKWWIAPPAPAAT